MADDAGVRGPAVPEDAHKRVPGYVAATDYATGYLCRHTQNLVRGELAHANAPASLPMLAHVNCAYLSTPDRPPTLLALKRHAQALCALVQQLCPASPVCVDRRGAHDPYQEHQAFDFLHDLSVPYDADDEWHLLPLNSLLNQVRSQADDAGPDLHCPLAEFRSGPGRRRRGEPRRPFAAHDGLLRHANECLEMLDHEYSASGGILSVLPTELEHDSDDLAAARRTLVGQWLLWSQHLVARHHELEISYGNALDLLAREAVVPAQLPGRSGPEAGAGRQVAFPQDRWVLANAGDDVFAHLHRLMDAREAKMHDLEMIYKRSGVIGERQWRRDGGGGDDDGYERGLVPVDVVTRYYRLREHGSRSTIFVLPAREHHPGVAQSREAEDRPTVVAVAQPTYPERVSDWERRNEAVIDGSVARDLVISGLQRDKAALTAQVGLLRSQLVRDNHAARELERRFGPEEREQVRGFVDESRRLRERFRELRSILPDGLPENFTRLFDEIERDVAGEDPAGPDVPAAAAGAGGA